MSYEGEVFTAPYVEHYPPDTSAAIFWLKNRKPDQWRDKTEQDINLRGDLAERIAAARKRAHGKRA